MTSVNEKCVPVLELENVGKKIGKKRIVENITLALQPSEIYGFLGPNGAGKTTTIRMIVGLIKPTEGNVSICGHDVQKNYISAMENVGCIIESPDMYRFMSGIENLRQFAAMDSRISQNRIDEVVEMVGLSHRIGDKVSTYSLGMRQRLGIAQAILNRPKLLILDEPVNGLDPAGITEFRRLIGRLAHDEGMAVFVSSHLLKEAQQMCDRVAIIRQGRIVKFASVSEITSHGGITEWEVSDAAAAAALIEKKFGMKTEMKGRTMLTADAGNLSTEAVNSELIMAGISVRYCRPVERTLEDLFLELTEGDEIV